MRRIRIGTGNILSAILLPLGIIGAVTLVVLAHLGGFDTAVFVVIGALVTVAAFISLEFAVLALILVASIDGFLKGLSPGWHTQLLKDYVLGICLLRWGWLSVLGHRRQSMRHPISVPIVLFIAWCGVQLLNARNVGPIMALTDFRAWVIWMPTFFLVYDYIERRQQIDRFVMFVLAVLTPISIYALIQYQIGLDHLFNLGSGFGVYRHSEYVTESYQTELRPPGTMISAHSLGGALVMGLMLAAGAIGYFKKQRHLQIFTIISMPILGMGLVVAAVRNAYGSAMGALLALLLLVRRMDLAVAAALIIALGAFQANQLTGGKALARLNTIITNPDATVIRIVGPWRTSIRHAARYPLGGGLSSGMGRGRLIWSTTGSTDVNPENRVPWIENEYGRTLVELGIPGFLLFIWMLFSVVRGIYRSHKSAEKSRDQWLTAGIFGAAVSTLMRLLVGSALYGWPEGILFWAYLAIALKLPILEQQESERERAPRSEAPDMMMAPDVLPWTEEN